VGHLNAANLPQGYPQFFASGEGATLVDVDGRRFIDFMCAWGPNYLGYRHPEVQEAVQRQLKAGRLPERPRENIPDVNSGVHSSNPLSSTKKSWLASVVPKVPKSRDLIKR
jgi:glutamate-1-semialdehyde aminotransferase